MNAIDLNNLHGVLSISRTREGTTFDPNQDQWSIRDGVHSASLNFLPWQGKLSQPFLFAFKKTLVWYGENRSLNHMVGMFNRTCGLLNYLTTEVRGTLTEISSVDVLNYHASLQQKWYLGSLSGFLKKWRVLGYEGVSDNAIKVLNQLRLRGNEKGVAILTMDPVNGPFTDIELESIQSALNQAYSNKELSTDDYLLAWLFMLLGQRPSQYALLKVCDVLAPTVRDGSYIYILKIPRVKQRTVARTEFKERLITPQIGDLLLQHANDVKSRFLGILPNVDQAPLFPEKRGSGLQPEGMFYHRTSSNTSAALNRVLGNLEVYSERTGDLVHISPNRFRRTIGTRAAQEGHGELIIAELLDHTDTQNVGVYVQATPEIVERIDRAVAMSLAPLAQAFAGVVIADESEASRGDDPNSRIVDPRIDKSCNPMGSCGTHGFCGFLAPIACYTCPSFQAWQDGPHEAVLNYLLADREKKLTLADKRIAAINDRTILAVAEVVRQCQAIQTEHDEVGHG